MPTTRERAGLVADIGRDDLPVPSFYITFIRETGYGFRNQLIQKGGFTHNRDRAHPPVASGQLDVLVPSHVLQRFFE
jgi:hypothetical protein